MIVALTGATGYVGRFLLKRFAKDGVYVRAWRRASSDLDGLPADIEWIEGDLGSDAAAELVRGADWLVHAALAHEPGRYRGGEGDDPTRFWQLNVDGSVRLLEAAREAGVKRGVVFSSRAVFGRNDPGPLLDQSRLSPDTHYGAVKAELETYIRKFAGWPVAALRPTGIYGLVEPLERSKWHALIRDVLGGAAIAARCATEVHGDDVAAATAALLTAPADAVAGRAFNCSDLVVSHRQITATVQTLSGVRGPLPDEGTAPAGIMRCDGLQALGVRFGGEAQLKRTVAALVSAIRPDLPAIAPADDPP